MSWYPEVTIGGFTHVDATIAFYAQLNSVLRPDFVVVDVGCGRGAAAEDPVPWRRELQILRGKCAAVIGVDVDTAGSENPTVDEFRLIEDERLPVADASIDVCLSDAVVEHVEDVSGFFAECARVLKPGGYLFVRTPNVWNYATIATRLVPNRFHQRVLSRVQPGRRGEDVFPTLYRCNTVVRLRRAFEEHGLDGVVVPVESEPAYLSFSRPLYALGVLHQRYAPRQLRRTLLAFGRKRGA